MSREQVFTLEATPLKYGRGAAGDAGWELERLGVKRAMLVSDPGVVAAGITDRVRQAIEASGISVEVWSSARVEPTADSFAEAAAFAVDGGFDGFVGLGGGSSIDTAKVSDLISTHGGEIMEYVNPPVGEGRKPPSPLKPLLAIPTTCGSGAEATTVAILDIPEQKVKTGISHRYLRPDQAIVDPSLTESLPAEVVASCGLDVICHAAESYIAKPYSARDAPDVAGRPAALSGRDADLGHLVGEGAGVRRPLPARRGGRRRRGARLDDAGGVAGGDRVRRGGRAHPARVRVSDRRAQARVHAGRLSRRPPVHPARAVGDRHRAGRVPVHLRGGRRNAITRSRSCSRASAADGHDALPDALTELMRDVGAPMGITELGYEEDDIDALVEGALKQQRLLVISPREAGPNELAAILRASL